MDFRGDDGVEPAADDGPDGLEDPGGFVDETDSEGFGVMGFEAFDEVFHGCVVLQVLVWLCERKEDKGGTIFAMENPLMSNTTAAVSTGSRSMRRAVSMM